MNRPDESKEASPYYLPTKPIFQRHRLVFYIIFFGVAIIAGMLIDLPWLFVGAGITLKGLDLFLFRFRHGWHWRLTDLYLIAAGLALFRISFMDVHIKDVGWLDDIAMAVFLCTLGIIYPLLTTLELWLMKLRLGRKRQAEVVDSLECSVVDPKSMLAGMKCPVFRIHDNDGKEMYVCDEWYSRAAYSVGESADIRVRPDNSTEIWDSKRVKDRIIRSWKFWLIYEAVMLLFFFLMKKM